MSLDIDLYAVRRTQIFDSNITHNCNRMADAAGIYDCLWRAPENGFTHAGQLIEHLTKGIAAMKADPEKFIALEPENKWGTYRSFLPWLERLLEACEASPAAELVTSR